MLDRDLILDKLNHRGLGGLMSDDRCPAVHATLNMQCERRKKDCWGLGVDHLITLEDGRGEFWPNLEGRTPMHEYFQLWITGRKLLDNELKNL